VPENISKKKFYFECDRTENPPETILHQLFPIELQLKVLKALLELLTTLLRPINSEERWVIVDGTGSKCRKSRTIVGESLDNKHSIGEIGFIFAFLSRLSPTLINISREGKTLCRVSFCQHNDTKSSDHR
jgi:hypothetical protein